MRKRLISMTLALFLCLSLIPASVIPVRAAGGGAPAAVQPPEDAPILGGVYNQTHLGKILDQVRKGHTATVTSVNGSIGPMFLPYSSRNVSQERQADYTEANGGFGIFQSTRYVQDKMDSWELSFRPREGIFDPYRELLSSGQVSLRLGAGFEDHGKSFPWIRFNGRELFRVGERNHYTGFETNPSIPLSSLGAGDTLTIGGDSCITPIQRAFVDKIWMVLEDNTAPSIRDAAYDSATRMLKLYTSEPVRWADERSNYASLNQNMPSACDLKLTATNPKSGQEAWTFDAHLLFVSQDEHGSYLSFRVDDQGQTDYSLTRVRECVFTDTDFLYSIYGVRDAYAGSDGAQHNAGAPLMGDLRVEGPVTDMAGNVLPTASLKNLDLSRYKLALDKEPPVITGISISGSMISSQSEAELDAFGQPTDWPGDLDRSAVFAGVGDQLYFTLEGNEELVCTDSVMVVNVQELAKDSTGTWVSHNISVPLATDRPNTYGPLTVDAGMYITDGSCIRPIRVDHGAAGGVMDKAGNLLAGGSLEGVNVRQKINLDTAFPEIKLNVRSYDTVTHDLLLEVTVADRSGWPTLHGVTGQLSDSNNQRSKKSEAKGLTARVALGAPGAWVYHSRYQFAISDSAENVPGAEKFQTRFFSGGDRPWEQCSFMEIPVINEGVPCYLHVKLDPQQIQIGEELPLGSLEFYGYAVDWAGNENPYDQPQQLGFADPKYSLYFDRKAPEISLVTPEITYGTGAAGTVQLPTYRKEYKYVHVSFDHGVYDRRKDGEAGQGSITAEYAPACQTVEYAWDRDPRTSDQRGSDPAIVWQTAKPLARDNVTTTYYDYDVGTYSVDTTGPVALHIRATDSSGNVSETVRTLHADVSTPTLNYFAGGDLNVPQPLPPITVWPSRAKDDVTLAYTKLTLQLGAFGIGTYEETSGTRYYAILWSDDSRFTAEKPLSVFDFDRIDWYNADGTAADKAAMKAAYGPANLFFEVGYAAAKPTGNPIAPTPVDGSVTADAAVIRHIRFAPVSSNQPHAIGGIGLWQGDQSIPAESSGDFLITGSFGGLEVRVPVTSILMDGVITEKEQSGLNAGATKLQRPYWGTGALDPERSCAILTDARGREVYKVLLRSCDPRPLDTNQDGGVYQPSPVDYAQPQSFLLPGADAQGNPLPSGRYTLTVRVIQKGDAAQQYAVEKTVSLYLNGAYAGQTGLLGWTHNFADFYKYSIDSAYVSELPLLPSDGQGAPYSSLTLTGQRAYRQTDRNGLFSTEAGFGDTEIYLGGPLAPLAPNGSPLGDLTAIQVWNAEYEKGMPAGKPIDYSAVPSFDQKHLSFNKDDKANRKWNLQLSVVDRESFDASGKIAFESTGAVLVPVLEGQTNVIRYRFLQSSGDYTPIREFTVRFADGAPTGRLNLTPHVGLQGLEALDFTVDSLFSSCGKVTPYLLYRNTCSVNGEALKGSSYSYTGRELKPGDVVSLYSHTNDRDVQVLQTYTDDSRYETDPIVPVAAGKESCHILVALMDDAGGVTLLIPQVGPGAQFERFAEASFRNVKLVRGSFLSEVADQTYNTLYPGEDTLLCAELFPETYDRYNLDFAKSYITVGGQKLFLHELNSDRARQLGFLPSLWEQRGLILRSMPVGTGTADDRLDVHLVSRSGLTSDLTYTQAGLRTAQADAPQAVWNMNDNRLALLFDFVCYDKADAGRTFDSVHSYDWDNGPHDVTVVDAFGREHSYTVQVDCAPKQRPTVTYDPAPESDGAITVTVRAPQGSQQTYTLTAKVPGPGNILEEVLPFQNNGTSLVTVVVDKAHADAGRELEVRWMENNLPYALSIPVTVGIPAPAPQLSWSYTDRDILPNGEVYGDVTVTVTDEYWALTDASTGLPASHTFPVGTPKGKTHTFTVTDPKGGSHTLTATLAVTPIKAPLTPEEQEELKKALKPSVLLQGHAAFVTPGQGFRDLKLHALFLEPETLNPVLTAPAGSTAKADARQMIDAMGWAVGYRFRVSTSDVGSVKLLIKQKDTQSVTFADVSDAIPGVTLSGAALDVTGNADFVLFAVNDRNNFVRMPMTVTALAPLPQPTVTQTPVEGGVKVTLSSAELTELAVIGGTGNTIVYDRSGIYALRYRCTYRGHTLEASLEVPVNVADVTAPQLVLNRYGKPISWSANYSPNKTTNQDVLAQMTFTKSIQKVTPVAAESQSTADVDAALTAAKVQILISGSRVTVRYGNNYGQALTLRCQAENGKFLDVKLEPVTTIDKQAPVITEAGTELAKDGRSVSLSFTADETVLLTETGRRYEKGQKIVFTAPDNGSYGFHFADLAGNAADVKTVTVSGIVKTNPTLRFSKTGADAGSADVSVLSGLRPGDSFFVQADRDCEITLNKPSGNRTFTPVTAGTWAKLTIAAEHLSLDPEVLAVDIYGNVARALLPKLTLPDVTAPTIALRKPTLVLAVDDAGILSELKANVQLRDDRDREADITLTLLADAKGTPFTAPAKPGLYEVCYQAKDTAGNTALRRGFLRLTSGQEKGILLNNQPVDPENVTLVSAGAKLPLSVNLGSAEPFRVSWKKGIKTLGQMKKVDVHYLLDGSGESQFRCPAGGAAELELPFDKTGFYTVCIATQGRQYFCFLVYVN